MIEEAEAVATETPERRYPWLKLIILIVAIFAGQAMASAFTARVGRPVSPSIAFGALLELVRRGDIAPGERVVLVVTGTGLKPYGYDLEYSSQQVTSDVDEVLAVLGVS